MKNKTIFKTIALALMCSPLLVSAAIYTRQLELGMSGSDVTSLQSYLAQDASIYPEGLVTGYFGPLTKAAVARFQGRNGISTVGRVGPQTLAFINNLMNGGNTGGITSNNQRVIQAANVSVSSSAATVSWNTAIPTTASVYYSTSPISISEKTDSTLLGINAPVVVGHTDIQTSHSTNISGLLANTLYYYVIYVRDGQGTEHILLPATFTTSVN